MAQTLGHLITEFGFTTGDGSSRVGTEQVKASDLAQTYRLLASRVSGPILYYTARDWPLTAAQWKQQCGSAPCVLDKLGSNPGHIPGTDATSAVPACSNNSTGI